MLEMRVTHFAGVGLAASFTRLSQRALYHVRFGYGPQNLGRRFRINVLRDRDTAAGARSPSISM